MPELPEVETSRRGIAPYLLDQTVREVVVRERRMRWPIPRTLEHMHEQVITAVERRAKYLLLHTRAGICIIHLGMSGSLRIVDDQEPVVKHDHVDWCLANGVILRLNDPRRFGAVLWWELPLSAHPLLAKLGPEPLTEAFDASHLYRCAQGRKIAVKALIMDNKVVVGVGNIYANEALFMAKIHPQTPANQVDEVHYQALTQAIKHVLERSIIQGGTTLRDFSGADGKPGYFKQQLEVYAREGQPCHICATPIESMRLAQRNTFYCPHCQPKVNRS